jgi:hypothetical protein
VGLDILDAVGAAIGSAETARLQLALIFLSPKNALSGCLFRLQSDIGVALRNRNECDAIDAADGRGALGSSMQFWLPGERLFRIATIVTQPTRIGAKSPVSGAAA